MLESFVVEQTNPKAYEEIFYSSVMEMCSTDISKHVSDNAGIVYFFDETKAPDFVLKLKDIVKDTRYFKAPGNYISYNRGFSACGVQLSGYSLLMEASSSFSVTLHESNGSSFVVGFWTVNDYLQATSQ